MCHLHPSDKVIEKRTWFFKFDVNEDDWVEPMWLLMRVKWLLFCWCAASVGLMWWITGACSVSNMLWCSTEIGIQQCRHKEMTVESQTSDVQQRGMFHNRNIQDSDERRRVPLRRVPLRTNKGRRSWAVGRCKARATRRAWQNDDSNKQFLDWNCLFRNSLM